MYILIIGCGRLGSELAVMLADEGHDVVVIDSRQQAFQRLGHTFNGMVVLGNGFNCEVLEEAGIKQAQAVAAVTDEDNINIITVQIAKQIYNVPIAIARIYDPKKANTYNQLGLDIVSSTTVIARMFRDRFIELRLEKSFESYGNRVEIYKRIVKGHLAGQKVQEISHPGLFTLITLDRKGRIILPKPDDVLTEGDIIMGVGLVESRERIENMLGKV